MVQNKKRNNTLQKKYAHMKVLLHTYVNLKYVILSFGNSQGEREGYSDLQESIIYCCSNKSNIRPTV